MKNHNRLYNLLAAGSLTALLGLTFLLFRGNGFGTAAGATGEWIETTTAVVNTSSAVAPALTSEQAYTTTQADPEQAATWTTLQAQNAKLTQMLQVMQERERQYQRQLQAASQALQASQAQPARERYAEDEHRDEHAYSGYEREEHEEHEEFGEQEHEE